ncbi:MAG: hypothetical protein CL845_09005 [Crocinitomicaceae bacterium]|nr:hypothetical protein [Crocinitomicaceae bacterium]|tara:strand:+ start:1624 stop:2304 length:681 start_codon:yes stop_codon:yes gene_type:complete
MFDLIFKIMKNIISSFFALFLLCSASSAQTLQGNNDSSGATTSDVATLSGPRFGLTFVGDGSTSQFLNRVHEMDSLAFSDFGSLPFTWTTQYGWQFETRFADTGGPVVGLVEWVVMVAGMEKGLILPSLSSLVGVRGESGFEFATGPNLSPSGLSFVFAAGFNYKKGDLNMPINIAFVPDKMGPRESGLDGIIDVSDYFDVVKMRETGYRLTISVGFNLSGKKQNR